MIQEIILHVSTSLGVILVPSVEVTPVPPVPVVEVAPDVTVDVPAPLVVTPALPKRFESIKNCESGSNYSKNTGNGYYGAYQFSLQTWKSVGGKGYPHNASPDEQDKRAQKLMASSGPGQWPNCA